MEYTNIRLLSSKDSFEVWLCEDADHTLFVKKIFLNSITDIEQLSKDYKLHSKLRHPAIPNAVEYISKSETTEIVYEYVEGITLRKYIDLYGTVGESTAIDWFTQLLDILDYIHTAFNSPIIHRDIKPGNIIIDKMGRISLIDFGIARVFRDSPLRDTVILGSHGFAPPEQYGLNQTDARTDLYSLAVTIYYAITGSSLSEPPYQVLPLQSFSNRHSGKLSDILLKATRPSPNDRFQSAAELKKQIIKHKQYLAKKKKRPGIIAALSTTIIAVAFFCISAVSQGIKYRDIPKPNSPAAYITDSLLYDALIISGVDYYPDGIITEDELRKSTVDLFLNNMGITDLTGMELMERTVHLELQSNPINNHTPLQSMTSLEVLYLDNTGLKTLYGFEQLKLLQLLSVEDNPISDISPILKLDALHDIWFSNTNVSDITGIGALYKLRDFSFRNCPISDISPLADLPVMNSVDLQDCLISTLEPISDKVNIAKLRISGNLIDFNDPK